MPEIDKDIQRREFIFKLLDEMKENGERINADKLARKAKMGKQTVLPHYSEWRFLDAAERQNDIELPEELVRVLKRGLIQWRIMDSEQQREFEEKANKEIDDLQSLVTQLSDELSQQKVKVVQMNDEQEALKGEIKQQRDEVTRLRESRIDLEARYQAETAKSEALENQIVELKQLHEAALETQEKKLDTQYQGQINHWMKMLDNERRLRTDVESKLEQQKNTVLSVEKERSDLQYRLEAKSRAYLDACSERNQYKEQTSALEPLKSLVHELSLILNEPSDLLISRVRNLLDDHQTSSAQLLQLSALEKKVMDMEHQLEATKGLEIELEKHKGYREAMEKALENAKWAGQTEE